MATLATEKTTTTVARCRSVSREAMGVSGRRGNAS